MQDRDDEAMERLADCGHVLRLAGKEAQARSHAERALPFYEQKGSLVGAQRMEAFLRRDQG